MRLQFKRDWRGNRAGDVKDVPRGIGEAYLMCGVAVEVKADQPKRKRGRPRKIRE